MANDWLFSLCGRPKVTDFPIGALSIRGITFQITGILMIIFILVVKIATFVGMSFQQVYFIGIWLGCLALGVILSLLLKIFMPLQK